MHAQSFKSLRSLICYLFVQQQEHNNGHKPVSDPKKSMVKWVRKQYYEVTGVVGHCLPTMSILLVAGSQSHRAAGSSSVLDQAWQSFLILLFKKSKTKTFMHLFARWQEPRYIQIN